MSVRLLRGGFAYTTSKAAEVSVSLKRWGANFAGHLQAASGAAIVRIPADRSRRTWRAVLGATSPLEICPA